MEDIFLVPWYYRTPAAVIAEVSAAFALKLHLISCSHLHATDTQYVHLFDRTNIPANGAIPLIELQVGPKGMASYSPAFEGREFTKGLVVALSSTPTVLTLAGVANLTYQIEGVRS